MTPFAIKQHEKTSPKMRALREEEIGRVTGGTVTKCPKGKDVTMTIRPGGGPAANDGCDTE
jgi:hypothetical protein